MKIINATAAAIAVTWLAGCAATKVEVRDRLGEKFIGRNVDEIVVEFGPPASTFKMNNGDTSYLWQLGASTNINTYRGSGSAQTFYCRLRIIASPRGIVSDVSTEDASNLAGESLCAMRLGMRRS